MYLAQNSNTILQNFYGDHKNFILQKVCQSICNIILGQVIISSMLQNTFNQILNFVLLIINFVCGNWQSLFYNLLYLLSKAKLMLLPDFLMVYLARKKIFSLLVIFYYLYANCSMIVIQLILFLNKLMDHQRGYASNFPPCDCLQADQEVVYIYKTVIVRKQPITETLSSKSPAKSPQRRKIREHIIQRVVQLQSTDSELSTKKQKVLQGVSGEMHNMPEKAKKVFNEAQVFRLNKESEALVFFQQSYQKLFTEAVPSTIPEIESVEIIFYNDQDPTKTLTFKVQQVDPSDQEPETLVRILFSDIQSQHLQVSKTLFQKVMPGRSNNPTLSAKKIFEKRCWVQVSAATNSASINFNDFSTHIQKGADTTLSTTLGLEPHQDWYNCQNRYRLNALVSENPKIPYQCLNCFQFKINFQASLSDSKNVLRIQEQQNIINQFMRVQILDLKRNQGSTLQKHPSILRNDANLASFPKQICSLYSFLQHFGLENLPNPDSSAYKDPKTFEYLSWKNLRSALDASVTTQVGETSYQLSKEDGHAQVKFQDSGALGLLLQIKSYDFIKKEPFRFKKFSWIKNKMGNLDELYNNTTYIRLQLCEKQGLAPGSVATLCIWPPYSCSEIHNRGGAYGVVKVLANQISVQYFNGLSFFRKATQSYCTKTYQQGDYTWMSNYSYGTQRFINNSNKTAITLHGFMSGKYAQRQYFQYINQEKQQYVQVFPQNDWLNFLNWPDLKQIRNSQDPTIMKLREKIDRIKQTYNLKPHSKNYFLDFVLALKKQYEGDQILLQKAGRIRNKKFTSLEQELAKLNE